MNRAPFEYREEPIPLLTYNPETKRYYTNDEGLDFINSLQGPLAVVGVAGLYRTGKSYLLNRMLLNRSDGFGVGPTVNPCTKGLWIWGKPIIGQTQEGDTINVVVLDSEGIGALDEDSTHDTKIFALAILLSSCFIYNSVGSIDENAVQNLSLVVNLTKTIHLRSKGNEELECEDYATYFPQFVWVVRDFSLQLVNQEGDPITSKEYLEMALMPQKGVSESVEAKNRIRRLLNSFFPDKDCYTLVRPLTNEESLQNLDRLDFDQLRPEFFEQVITMRKRILNRMRPKQLHGKNLSGNMFSTLIKSYVDAINNGASPNIESAWNYICKNECQKAMSEALENYERIIKEILGGKLPVAQDELREFHKIAKTTVLAGFKKKAIGEIADSFVKELSDKIKEKMSKLRIENERESFRVCTQFISNEFSTIDKKLKLNEYKSYRDFEKDVKLFHQYFLENGPVAANKQIIIMEFVQKVLSDGANYFLRAVAQEADLQKTLSTELQRKLEDDIKEKREENERERKALMEKISIIESQKTQIELKENFLREQMNDVQVEKENLEKRLKEEKNSSRDDFERTINELRSKCIGYEENMKKGQRENILLLSEFEKEKALLLQKNQHLEKSLDEYNRKEKEQTNEVKNTKKDHMNQLRELTMKYETANKALQNRVNELQEKLLDLESEMASSNQKFEMEKKKMMLNEKNQSLSLQEANNTILRMQNDIHELRASEDRRSENALHESERVAFHALNEKASGLERILREKEEGVKNARTEFEKEKAVLAQKNEFLELQLNESRLQLAENKKAHEAILKALESNNEEAQQSARADTKHVAEIKEAHRREIKNLESEFEATKKRLLSQIELMTERSNEIELKFKFEISDMTKEIDNLKEQLEQSEVGRIKLIEQNKVLDSQKFRFLKEAEDRCAARIKGLELELEEQQNKSVKEVKDIRLKSEEQLVQLRNFYEVERERLEKRLLEEKERSERRFSQFTEEFEIKMKEEQSNYEEEIENLKEELKEQEIQSQNLVQQYEHELALRQKTIETLEKYVKETRESLVALQSANSTNMEHQIVSFEKERKNLLEKIDKITAELSKKEKEFLTISQQKDYTEHSLKKKESQLENIKKESTSEKESLNSKIEDLKGRVQKLNDELLEKKIDFGREVALSKQQNEFLSKRLEDYQRQNDGMIDRYEEKLKLQKVELLQEFNEKLEKINEEKGSLEQKYEKARKTLKEIEGTYNKQLSQLEREKAITLEKLQSTEGKKSEVELRYQSESQNLVLQIAQLRENFNIDKKTLLGEIEKYKALYLQLEQEKNELLTNYERDKVLWEGKFTFLESQKEQAKQDLVDALKKFEMTLHHLKKARNNEKNEQETNLNELLISIERKYQSQIQDLNDNHQRVVQDYEDKIRKLEKELKNSNEKLMMDTQGKLGHHMMNEKKLNDYVEAEKKMKAEIENLKEERDLKILEQQRLLDAERESMKMKMAELEQKYKESENKRSAFIFEHEKERARWSLEKDHLITQRNELQETIEKLEKKKESLLRENEKLKSDSRISRRSINLMNTTLTSNVALNTSKTTKAGNPSTSPISSANQAKKAGGEKNLSDITNFSGIMAYDPNKTFSNHFENLNNTSYHQYDDYDHGSSKSKY